MSKQVSADLKAAQSSLRISRGPWFPPLFLIVLLAVGVMFSGQSGLDMLRTALFTPAPAVPVTGEVPPVEDPAAQALKREAEKQRCAALVTKPAAAAQPSPARRSGPSTDFDDAFTLIQCHDRLNPGRDLKAFGADVLKYLPGLTVAFFSDFRENLQAKTIDLLKVMALISILSLAPGLAGLVCRRDFWSWFLLSWVVLAQFHAARAYLNTGSQTAAGASAPVTAQLVDAIFPVILSQFLFLFIAYRIRRFSSGRAIPAALYNRILAIFLTVVGIACLINSPAELWARIGLDGGLYKWEFLLIGLPLLYALFRQSLLWEGKSPKNIVVCLDGTSNTPDQQEFGQLAQTNVYKLFHMLKPYGASQSSTNSAFNANLTKRFTGKRDGRDIGQIGFYYAGVGNKYDNNPISQILGLASGAGAGDIVEKAYLDVIRVYRPGDRIFIVGFSRGAAMARLLSRTMDQRGAPRTVWTIRLLGRHWTIWTSKRNPERDRDFRVTVLGCFDTVGSFGISKKFAGIDFQQIDLFQDLTVPDSVEQAYHMVALDEEREEFRPTLMDVDPIHPGRIVEVWFSGDHANIGGGWATTELSDTTLDFLLKRVSSGYAHTPTMKAGDTSWGIFLDAISSPDQDAVNMYGKGPFELNPKPSGLLRKWESKLYNYVPRKLPLHAVVSDYVFERMAKSLPVYAPRSLFNLNAEILNQRQLVISAAAGLDEAKALLEGEKAAILEWSRDQLRLTRWSASISRTSLETKRMETALANPPETPGKKPAGQARARIAVG